MKNLFLTIVVLGLLFSCDTQSERTENPSTTQNPTSTETPVSLQSEINMEGPDLELNVISFSTETNETVIEIINRSSNEINNVRGRLILLDENHEPLTTVTGRPIESPFQKAENPFIVGPRSKTTFKLNNSLDDRAESIEIKNIIAKSTSGETIEIP